MADITFVTENSDKMLLATHALASSGLRITQASPHIDEIQSIDGELIARHKSESAYRQLRRPTIITDDSWTIPGLHGFPGPFMKYMNQWLTAADFLRLTAPLTDRSTVLHQILIYQDEHGQQVFKSDVNGQILAEAKGNSSIPWTTLVSLEDDNGKSIAEAREEGMRHNERFAVQIWHDFAAWYQTNRP